MKYGHGTVWGSTSRGKQMSEWHGLSVKMYHLSFKWTVSMFDPGICKELATNVYSGFYTH